jgi:hypothetical protein
VKSRGPMPKSSDPITRDRASAAGMPKATPAAAKSAPSRRTTPRFSGS